MRCNNNSDNESDEFNEKKKTHTHLNLLILINSPDNNTVIDGIIAVQKILKIFNALVIFFFFFYVAVLFTILI